MSLTCPEADAIIFRIQKNSNLKDTVRIELVETVKDYTKGCENYWDAND